MLVNLNPRALTIPIRSTYPTWNRIRIGHSIDPQDYIGVKPIINYADWTQRDHNYDLGRIVYFRNLFTSGCAFAVLPIDIWIVDYQILIADGYHRLAGACLAEQETIKCEIIKKVNNARINA